MGKAIQAMVAAAGLPPFGDEEAWGRIGAWWRDHGEPEADLTKCINDLEDAEAELREQLEAAQEDANENKKYAVEAKAWRDQNLLDFAAVREDNAALRKVIDKFTMTVPAVAVRQALDEIVARCGRTVPDTRGGSDYRAGPNEPLYAVLRACANDARRALTAMDTK